ncbi:hypothetical protein PROFUN_12174 [Planoprotostelium fungivorum]|uniref:Hemicentin-1-like von Willebrand factor A domain-containing protein n=1 Tax=Planoprotostelium fungivorum TaxID=1890364 RepID=A0A2P6N8H1_9EUKA|nr:hypothetical protein PROFUN_12174 [Planoprotostelium fungivorum]
MSTSDLKGLEDEQERLLEELARLRMSKKGVDESKSRSKSSSRTSTRSVIPTVSVEQEEEINLELEALKAELASLTPHESDSVRSIQEQIAEASALNEKLRASSSARDAEVAKRTEQLNRFRFGLDLCFLVDVTYSMHPWIKAVRDKVGEVITAAMTIDSRVIPRVSFVGYRDHCDEERFFTIDFAPMDELVNLQEQLDECEAIGGGDGPEDVCGGFDQALHLDWQSSTRLIIHIADAPCHGRQYHNFKDDYPEGDPTGLSLETLLGKVCDKRIDLYFGKINNRTDKMTNIFREELRKRNKPFTILNLSDPAKEFLPEVIASVSKSMNASRAPQNKTSTPKE